MTPSTETMRYLIAKLLVASACALAAQVLPVAAFGQSATPPQSPQSRAPSPQEQCAALSVQDLQAASRGAITRTSIESRLSVLPGGQITKVHLPVPLGSGEFYCAAFVEDGLMARVMEVTEVKVAQDDRKRIELTLSLPDIGFGWQRPRQLVVASFPEDTAGKLNTASPGVYATRQFPVSNGLFATLGSLAIVVLAYAAAVLALGRVGRSYSLDPVYLTSDSGDKASLSQFQIFGFTLIVLGVLTFIVLRTGLLSDISRDVLLLLGISAVGAAGSKVADHMKKRLSYENWSWLRNNKWLDIYETGIGKDRDSKRALWSDLLKTSGDFDIYSFQLAVFSTVVAYALVTGGVDQLATFEIPDNLKGLLGLSNVVYIGGKAITPNSVGELDDKVGELRNAELVWIGKVVNSVTPLADPLAKLNAAKTAAPVEYQAYIGLARETARMLKSQYGAEETKFSAEPIADSELMPVFP